MSAPNHGGAETWLVVMGASLLVFCTVGLINAFGIFQAYYQTTYLSDKSASEIGWISSVTIFFLYIFAPVAGIIVDKFGPRLLVGLGSISMLIAIFMTSLCTQYYQFLLAQSVMLGISMAFMTWPSLGVVGRHLPKRRGLALGLVVGGSSIGGVIWPIMLDQLLNKHGLGFPWTMRVIGFTMLPLLLVAFLTIKEPRQIPAETASDGKGSSSDEANTVEAKPVVKKTDLSILRNRSFLLLCAGVAIAFFGVLTPIVFIPSYTTQSGIASDSMGFYLISILNAASLPGRVIPGLLADKFGHFNVFILAICSSALIVFCWTAVHNLAGLVVFCLVYGFASGAIIGLQSACAGKIATRETQGTAMGFLMGSLAITCLVSTPIAGQLETRYGYLALSIFCGVAMAVGGVLVLMARLSLDRRLSAKI